MNKKQAQLKKKIVSFFEKRTKDIWGTVLQVIFLLLICILFSLQSGHYANFFPITTLINAKLNIVKKVNAIMLAW